MKLELRESSREIHINKNGWVGNFVGNTDSPYVFVPAHPNKNLNSVELRLIADKLDLLNKMGIKG